MDAVSAALDVPSRGDVIGVFLGVPLRHQESVIAASPARIFAADGGAGGVYRAAALIGVEEPADLAEMGVSLAPHGIGLFAVHLGELLARRLEAEAEMVGQPLHIALLERDQGIGAAIARAFRTIIGDH